MSVLEQNKSSSDVVLAKAIVSAVKQLGLKQAEVACALGMHRTAFRRLIKAPSLDPTSKQGELALIVVRIARALFALTGGDETWIKRFMRTHNKITGGIPAKQIASLEGLMSVLRFVDTVRGKA
ncbi:MAG: MbcA/ParS/Xre antitoxin family protein [Cycloclasticus sp.]|nr:MbcA/ParS/Xre antitoxin family protein [Cycloclasticus sp.]